MAFRSVFDALFWVLLFDAVRLPCGWRTVWYTTISWPGLNWAPWPTEFQAATSEALTP
jgi:hypothetical protein